MVFYKFYRFCRFYRIPFGKNSCIAIKYLYNKTIISSNEWEHLKIQKKQIVIFWNEHLYLLKVYVSGCDISYFQ